MIAVFFMFITTTKAIYTDSQVKSYEEELAKFPASYQEKIKKLHDIYPNAIFVAQTEFFDWNKYKEVTVKWSDMLKAETGAKSLISYTAQNSFKTSTCGQKSGSVCSWYYASQEAITYYMNSYNFLNEKDIFMFESLYSKSYHTKEGVEKILENSFMANKECPGSNGKTYAEVILEAGAKNNVSPYMLASRLIQEQGKKGTSSLISGTYEGYEGYYNYFNIQASGETDKEIIENGLKCASGVLKSNNRLVCSGASWTSPYISIIEGSKFVYEEYIGINDTHNVKGQMTLYLQKWDPYGPKLGGHQYMQNISAPVTEAATTFKSYSSFEGYKEYSYIFYIPIYEGAPNTSTYTTPSEIIAKVGYKEKNDYLSGIKIGTSQNDFVSKIKNVNSNATVTIEKNTNNKTNILATGDKITIKVGDTSKTYTVVIYGDVNGDGSIKATDYVKIKNHIMGTNSLSGAYQVAADVNKDGSIKATDYVFVKNHIMGSYTISQ
jgi:hypothetical protein